MRRGTRGFEYLNYMHNKDIHKPTHLLHRTKLAVDRKGTPQPAQPASGDSPQAPSTSFLDPHKIIAAVHSDILVPEGRGQSARSKGTPQTSVSIGR